MMDELKEVKKAVNPTEVLLVVDAMTGQEAAGIFECRFNVLPVKYLKKKIVLGVRQKRQDI